MTLRIVVADDHGIVREGLGALLSAHDGYELAGTAATGAEAVRSAVTLRPDVLVMDIQMPDLTGIEATRQIARRALEYLSGPRPDQAAFPELTPREREVLDLIAAGLGNAAIAARLGLAPATVGNHITSIFGKLQVASRAEAIIRARSAGLGDDR